MNTGLTSTSVQALAVDPVTLTTLYAGTNGSGACVFQVVPLTPPGIPTLPQWGMILLTLSLLTVATWQLAGRPVAAGASGTVALLPSQQWMTSLLLGQGIATVGLGLYALLIGPLVPHDGVGALLSGVLIGAMVECYRRSR